MWSANFVMYMYHKPDVAECITSTIHPLRMINQLNNTFSEKTKSIAGLHTIRTCERESFKNVPTQSEDKNSGSKFMCRDTAES